MSQLDQAKKEAKRLFNLAKANQEKNQSQEIELSIPKLSSAREIVAVMNGYKNWHDYEEVLKRKDYVFGKVDKNTENKEIKEMLENKKYFIQDIEFNTIHNPNQFKKDTAVVMKSDHKPIVLGHKKEKSFFENKEKYWKLNQYPVLITGSTGAGKTEVLLSLGSQYIKNNEGLIYIDGKGDNVLYVKMFSYAKENNRLNDLYCLNFMTSAYYLEKQPDRKISHSIDPLNPMVGNTLYFESFFGKEIGSIVHAILKNLHEKGQLMDIQSLESILMLNNLMQWRKDNKFDNLTEINEYLVSIGLSLQEDNDENDLEEALEQHALKCMQAHKTVGLLKLYPHVFKIDCSVNMTVIFIQRNLLLVLLPALEKSVDTLILLGELITAQIAYTEEKINLNTHLQNIILDEFIYYSKNVEAFKLSSTKNNYIFASQDFGYRKKESFNYIIQNAKTYIAMKAACFDFPDQYKLQLIENASELPKEVFGNDGKFMTNLMYNLKNQYEGQAIIFSLNNENDKEDLFLINNQNKYYTQKIKCVYLPASKPKDIWLVDHATPIIYIKEQPEKKTITE